MPIPALGTMQPDVYFVSRPDKLIRKPWPAARAEDNACLTEGAVNLLISPAGVPELNGVAARRIELTDDRIQPRLGVTEADPRDPRHFQ